jgi:hypothetical protein
MLLMGALPPNPRDLAQFFTRMDDFDFAPPAQFAVQWKRLIGG